MSETPRIAGSLDDLKVGQHIAWRWRDEDWSVHRISEVTESYAWTSDGGGISPNTFADGPLVILSDPPAPPVTVPAALVDELRVAVSESYKSVYQPHRVVQAARALVAAVEGQDVNKEGVGL